MNKRKNNVRKVKKKDKGQVLIYRQGVKREQERVNITVGLKRPPAL